ncbi:hypothetical protein D3C81_2016480 [compost metagenome]
MPEKAVARAGKNKGYADLTVPVGKLQCTPLQVKEIMLVLPHPEQLLLRVGFQTQLKGIITAARMGL